jgi:excisionase family DNA binding protein
LIDTAEAARMLNCSNEFVRTMCRRETLVADRMVGSRWLVDRLEVHVLIAGNAS